MGFERVISVFANVSVAVGVGLGIYQFFSWRKTSENKKRLEITNDVLVNLDILYIRYAWLKSPIEHFSSFLSQVPHSTSAELMSISSLIASFAHRIESVVYSEIKPTLDKLQERAIESHTYCTEQQTVFDEVKDLWEFIEPMNKHIDLLATYDEEQSKYLELLTDNFTAAFDTIKGYTKWLEKDFHSLYDSVRDKIEKTKH